MRVLSNSGRIAMPLHTTLCDCFAEIEQHFHQVVLPLWYGPGWNSELALPYEALDHQGAVLPVTRYRAMACARQLYVFTQLIDHPTHPDARVRAEQLFRSLNKHFHDAEYGGWFYSIDAKGAPLDTRKDLYTHAFIIFACAHFFRVTGDQLAEATLNAALEVVGEHFADGHDLYHAELARDWQALGSGALQNPLMHLTEALLAVLDAREDEHTQQALLNLCQAMNDDFVEPTTGLLMEKPLGSEANWFEPGHQFEWLYLLATSFLNQSPLHLQLIKGAAFAEAHGLSEHGAVLAALDCDGHVQDATKRIWAQAEHLRALTLKADNHALLNALEGFKARFLHNTGWNEALNGDGALSRADLPSTTAYHLATAYSALRDYLS